MAAGIEWDGDRFCLVEKNGAVVENNTAVGEFEVRSPGTDRNSPMTGDQLSRFTF